MRLNWVLGFVAAILPCAVLAEVTEDAFRAMIAAGDIAAVEAKFAEALAAESPDTEPDLQRDLFGLFIETAPSTEQFLDRWLAQKPDSALAMTANGWHHYALGWNVRGTANGRNVYPDAIALMRHHHAKAWDLAEKAAAAEPGLIGASDLKLMLTKTLGNPEIIPGELERIMTRHPNRGSLMRAMATLAPQWGGSPAQVKLLCERYAPMITSEPDYDVQVCAVDAVYSGGFWDGDQREEAHQLLQLLPNPVLDDARLQDALDGYGPPQQRVRLLEAQKALRALDTNEARALDAARAEAGGPEVLISQDEWKLALASAVDRGRIEADQDPYNPVTVMRYVATLQDAENLLGRTLPRDEVILRLQTLLGRVPHAAEVWRNLADMTLGPTDPGSISLDQLEQVEAHYINAVVYSNYDYDMVSALVWGKYWAIVDPANVTIPLAMSALTEGEVQRLDRVVNCPMIRQFKILQIVCMNQGIAEDQCGSFPSGPFPVVARLQEVNDRGACPEEVTRAHEDLAYSPIKIDFPPAP